MVAIFALVLISTLLLAAASPPALQRPASSPDSSKPGCTDELVAFSPCLGYVSAAPNNVTDTATSQCCDAFSKALSSGDGNCFCYLMRQPLIFGFPLNESRLASLHTVCESVSASFWTMNNVSMESICSESPALPPLRSSTGIQNPKPPGSAADNGSFFSTSGQTPESVTTSPNAVQPPPKPTSRSSAVEHSGHRNSRYLTEVLTCLFVFLSCH